MVTGVWATSVGALVDELGEQAAAMYDCCTRWRTARATCPSDSRSCFEPRMRLADVREVIAALDAGTFADPWAPSNRHFRKLRHPNRTSDQNHFGATFGRDRAGMSSRR
jgi:hypothetical protein